MKKQKNFKRKVSKICGNDEVRTILQYIYFEDGNLICTNAHILLIQSLKEHNFTDEEIEILNGKFLHKNVFDAIYKHDYVTVNKKGFKCVTGEVECVYSFSESPIGKYLEYKSVIPDGVYKPLTQVGVNLKLLKLACKVTFSTLKAVNLGFSSEKTGITMLPIDSRLDNGVEKIIVMPVKTYN